MRKITVDCEMCGDRVPMERVKEALFENGRNTYHLIDVCTTCLDPLLQRAESVNDTSGFRKTAAVLIRLPGGGLPDTSA